MEEDQSYPEPGAGHGSWASYIGGFGLSVLLTGGAFSLVWLKPFSARLIFESIVALALVQMFVHLTLFLHLNRSSTQRWDVVVLAFAALIIVILISGSLWIMTNANNNMMPMPGMTQQS
jgi:cytochrome o ubiquinol oxidase operon protein cyoD